MNEGIMTSRYAKAFYQLGEEEGKTESFRNDILVLLELVKDSPEFNNLINSPIIKENKKNQLVQQLFEGKLENYTLSFVQLLIENRREQYLNRICLAFLQLYKKEKGITEGTFITAQVLEKEFLQKINKQINKQFNIDVELNEVVDANLIGGFKLILNDTQIDASIASKLKKIKTELINS